jgi:hypothetical protein
MQLQDAVEERQAFEPGLNAPTLMSKDSRALIRAGTGIRLWKVNISINFLHPSNEAQP